MSVDEAQALDDAAEMIESRQLPEGAIESEPEADDLPPPADPQAETQPDQQTENEQGQ